MIAVAYCNYEAHDLIGNGISNRSPSSFVQILSLSFSIVGNIICLLIRKVISTMNNGWEIIRVCQQKPSKKFL